MIYQGYGKKIGCGNKYYYCAAFSAVIGSGRKKRPMPGCRRCNKCQKRGIIFVKKCPLPNSYQKCRCRSLNGIINIRDPCTMI